MCELLIMAINKSNPDPEKDKGCYKRGDIVTIHPDNHIWGDQEGLPTFIKIKIPGLTVDMARKVTEQGMDLVTGEVMTVRRKWNLLIDSIPTSIKNNLLNKGEVTVTVEQVRNFIQNKITMETF